MQFILPVLFVVVVLFVCFVVWGGFKFLKISSRVGAAKSVRSFLARCSKHCAMTTTLMNSAFADFFFLFFLISSGACTAKSVSLFAGGVTDAKPAA